MSNGRKSKENRGGGDSDIESDADADMFDQMEENLQDTTPLGEGVLQINLGIPIIVACHKVDLITHGEKAQFLENNIDFI